MTQLRTNRTPRMSMLMLLAAAAIGWAMPAQAQGARGHLQEEGIEAPSRGSSASRPIDASDPRFVSEYRKGLETTVKRRVTDPAQLDAMITNIFSQRLSEPKMEIMRRNIRAMTFNDGFYTRLVNLTLPMVQANVPKERVMAVVSSSFTRVQIEGMSRLEESDIETFLVYSYAFMQSIPPQLCKRLINGELSSQESAYLERQYVASRPDAEFTKVMDMYLRASSAVLNDHPKPPHIEPDEFAAAKKIFDQALIRRMATLYPLEKALRIMEDTASASPAEACDVGKSVYRTILEMPAPFRRWQMQALMNEIAK